MSDRIWNCEDFQRRSKRECLWFELSQWRIPIKMNASNRLARPKRAGFNKMDRLWDQNGNESKILKGRPAERPLCTPDKLPVVKSHIEAANFLRRSGGLTNTEFGSSLFALCSSLTSQTLILQLDGKISFYHSDHISLLFGCHQKQFYSFKLTGRRFVVLFASDRVW
jgi:hypothetical protein